jgi:hypothetical protein
MRRKGRTGGENWNVEKVDVHINMCWVSGFVMDCSQNILVTILLSCHIPTEVLDDVRVGKTNAIDQEML